MGASSKTGRYFTSQVLLLEGLSQLYKDSDTSDTTIMRLRLTRNVGSRFTFNKNVIGKEGPGDIIVEKFELVVDKLIAVPHLSRFRQNPRASRQVMEEVLSSMGVPEQEHYHILRTIFDAILAPGPEMPILVVIFDITMRLRSVDEVAVQPDFPKLVLNQGVERVHRDSLEANGESLSCVICMEEFGTVGVDSIVTRLPCLHLFHAHCIFRWLRGSCPMCPLCRYSMPHVYVLSYMLFTHDETL